MLLFNYSGYPCQLINHEFILTISLRGYIRIEVIKPKKWGVIKKNSQQLENLLSIGDIFSGDLVQRI